MLNAFHITEYIIKVHTKNIRRKIQEKKTDKQNLSDDAMRINYTRLVSLTSEAFSLGLYEYFPPHYHYRYH